MYHEIPSLPVTHSRMTMFRDLFLSKELFKAQLTFMTNYSNESLSILSFF